MEPTTEYYIQPGASRNDQAVMSIAISLKRIADAMQSPNEYGEIGGEAIAGAISRSLRDR